MDVKYNDGGQICTFYWILHLQSRPDYPRRKIITTSCRIASNLAIVESKMTPSTKRTNNYLSILNPPLRFHRLCVRMYI